MKWDSHIHLSTNLCAKFELSGVILGSARVCGGGVGGVGGLNPNLVSALAPFA